MSSRLENLQRQRALMLEHLRWLESEIAEASRTDAGAPSVHIPVAAPAEAGATPAIQADPAPLPEANVRGIHNEVRNGCLLYFGLACAAVGIVVAYIYWRY